MMMTTSWQRPTDYGLGLRMVTYLDRILDTHRQAAALDDRRLASLIAQAIRMPAIRSFGNVLRRDPMLSVIAEVKRRSPSKGDLNPDLDPVELARTYERGGAACLSVLTDGEYFGGSAHDLQYARAATRLPVLRKDFTVSARDICDARLMNADCVLLIAAAVTPAELIEFHQLADEIGLEVLVEIHDERELEVAMEAGARIIGVNQRDLVTFQVDNERALRMAAVIPDTVVKVAESGVRGAADARNLGAAGYDAVLVGELLVTATDPAATIKQLRGF
jgi:indole-3-glycerol phosphate synthase